MRRVALAAVLLASTLAACGIASPTVLLVRHAEKGPGRDPDLTGEGRRRALALIEISRQAKIEAAYHTQFRRTAQTAEPSATHLGIPLIPVEYTPGQEAEHAEALVRDIEEHFAGCTVLIVGHTTTIPAILKKLGVEAPRAIPETEYGTLFVVINGQVHEQKFAP